MRFIVTLHLQTMPIPDEDQVESWQNLVQHALKQIPGVDEAEVEPEHIRGSGDQ